MPDRFSFLGHPMSDDTARGLVDGLTVHDDTTGQSAVRQRTERLVPLLCACGHRQAWHGRDHRNRPICRGSSQCGCAAFAPGVAR
jgi:hypothetical protein